MTAFKKWGLYFCLLAIVFLLALCWRMQSLVEQYGHRAKNGSNVVLSITHPVIDALLNHYSDPSTSKEGDGLRQSIRQAALYLMDGGVSLSDLDADGFEALCKLIANQGKILQPSRPAEAIGGVDSAISNYLLKIANEAKDESKRRSMRLGDQHRCVLK